MNLRIGEDTIHYLSFGKGEIVILLPSLWTSSRSYRALGIALGRHYHVIIPDLYRGESRFRKMATNIAAYVETLHEFTQKLNLSHFCLIGVSFSGITAIHFMHKYPSLVRKAYLVSTTADPLEMDKRFFRLALGYPKILFHNLSSLRGIKADLLWLSDGFSGLFRHPWQMVWDGRMALGELLPKQTMLPVPSKLLFSKKDEFVPYRFVEPMRSIKNLDIEVHDSHHCWFFGREDVLAEKIVKFFDTE